MTSPPKISRPTAAAARLVQSFQVNKIEAILLRFSGIIPMEKPDPSNAIEFYLVPVPVRLDGSPINSTPGEFSQAGIEPLAESDPLHIRGYRSMGIAAL